jgi:hypothetical protein
MKKLRTAIMRTGFFGVERGSELFFLMIPRVYRFFLTNVIRNIVS